jgi:hypothetical protein
MKLKPNLMGAGIRSLVIALCVIVVVPGNSLAYFQPGQPAQSQTSPSGNEEPKIPPEQLDALVAPIALFPDPLLAQTLAASTYPLEIVQLQQWLQKNPQIKGDQRAAAVAKQPWDPSVQAMAALPQLVKRLADDIEWTTDLGNAFLAQQADVMDAIQRMRKKAKDKGTLKSGEQQKVQTKVVEGKEVIVIEQANPQVVYVPSYDPVIVYGAPVYPYPPIYYPPPDYYGGIAVAFGLGILMGAAWSGGWGWGCGWGHNDIDINVNNNFNRRANVNRTNVNNRTGGTRNTWQHNPQHRGGTPYGNRATANRYGGTVRSEPFTQRQAGSRQELGRQGGNLSSSSGRGGDRIGGRDISPGSGGGSAFGGGSGSYSGSRANASSSRGSSSLGSSGGRGGFGGGGRGGGGFGGGRGGGGRR